MGQTPLKAYRIQRTVTNKQPVALVRKDEKVPWPLAPKKCKESDPLAIVFFSAKYSFLNHACSICFDIFARFYSLCSLLLLNLLNFKCLDALFILLVIEFCLLLVQCSSLFISYNYVIKF